jgi:competence protein ComEC
MQKKTGDLNSDLLKVGHHGSISSTSIDFLKQVKPTYAVISVGKDNRYGHPHKEIIERLTEQNVEILRTDELGTIILTSDGNDLSYEIIKNSENVTNQ